MKPGDSHELLGRSHHDMGGLPAGKVDRNEHDYADWERRVDALNVILRAKGVYTIDQMRKNIEALPPAAYDSLAYYEKWVMGLAQTLIQRGAITTEELGRKMEQIQGRPKAAASK